MKRINEDWDGGQNGHQLLDELYMIHEIGHGWTKEWNHSSQISRLLFCVVLTIGMLVGNNIPARAINQRVLGDSLTIYANQFARVGKVKITRLRVNQTRAEIFTNKSLSYLSLDKDKVDNIRRIVIEAIFEEAAKDTTQHFNCLIFTDGYELSELLNEELRENVKYVLPVCTNPLVTNQSRVYDASKGLDGFHIALYGSHGLYYHQKDQRWTFQRARLLTTVEDLYTSSYTMPFLVPMLENAGAVVIQPRERDTQLNEVIVDDSDINTDGFKRNDKGGFGHITQPLTEGENPFHFGGYSYAQSVNDTANATQMRYIPQVPEDGEYAVYVSYKTLQNSTKAAEYTVKHNGIETLFKVNQQMAGSTWVYLGTFFFTGDEDNNYVSVSNYTTAGGVVSTDAIKFGGGMGNVARYMSQETIDNIKSSSPQVDMADTKNSSQNSSSTALISSRENGEISGFPRYIEGARYWMQYSGVPDSVYNYTSSKNDYIDDYASRGKWMNWVAGGSAAYPNQRGWRVPIHLGMAFHTDAGLTKTDSIVGSLVIYKTSDNDSRTNYPTGVSRLAARIYSDYVQTQIVEDIRSTFAPEWQRRELMNSSYAEARHPKIPTLLLELLSHQNPADMKYGLDPRFRFIVSRAIYKGMLKYLHEQYGTPYIVQPLPVRDFSINFESKDALKLTWQASIDTLEETAQAKYYIVYTRKSGLDWDNGTKVFNTYYEFEPEKDTQYDFKIVAGNEGGCSFASEVLSANISSQSNKRVLIVNGFTRVSAPEWFHDGQSSFGFTTDAVSYGKEINFIGRQHEYDMSKSWTTDDNGGFGQSYMDQVDGWHVGNTFDYPTLHGQVLTDLGYSFVSTSVSVLQSIDESIDIVDFIGGKQKQYTIGTVKQLVDFATFTTETRTLLRDYVDGGGKLLVSGAYLTSDDAADDEFLSQVLHIKRASRNATKSGKITVRIIGEPTQQALLLTEPNMQTIHCEKTDGIAPADIESQVIARYKDSFIGAGVAHENPDNNAKTLVFAFPLESLQEFRAIYQSSIQWLTK